MGIGRPVVIKFLHAILSDKPGIVDRFEREARATARLNHPNCVALVDFGIDDGAPYLVMEFVEGKTLADLLDHGAVKAERAVEIVAADPRRPRARARARHPASRSQAGQRDDCRLRRLPGDFVKILDFGLAKLAWPGEDKRDVTVEGIAIGTPGYMSPEQAAGVPSDRRSDIYCTGALLYHLVTGTKAFEGDDVRSVLRRHREETPASPREIKPAAGISKELEDVLVSRDAARSRQALTSTRVTWRRRCDSTPECKRADGAPTSHPRCPARARRRRSADATRARRARRAPRRGRVVLGLPSAPPPRSSRSCTRRSALVGPP